MKKWAQENDVIWFAPDALVNARYITEGAERGATAAICIGSQFRWIEEDLGVELKIREPMVAPLLCQGPGHVVQPAIPYRIKEQVHLE